MFSHSDRLDTECMTEAIEKLDAETREQLLQHLGVNDVSQLPDEGEDYEAITSYFSEQASALLQEFEAVRTRMTYLQEQLQQYVGVDQ
jgi:hypothetical protein